MPKFPDVEVQLSGEDGNAFGIIGKTMKALRHAGHEDASREYQNEAMSSASYDEVIQTTMRYVEVL
jgi:hypothetical protein